MVPKIRDALFLFRKKFKRKKCEFFEMSGITEKNEHKYCAYYSN